MTNETMIERVARAIYEADDPWSQAFAWPDMGADDQSADNYRRIARAAIEAMRVNTPEMCTAGNDAIDDAESHRSSGVTVDTRSVACWRAMIDAAIPEEVKR